jgi:hypothetical protein
MYNKKGEQDSSPFNLSRTGIKAWFKSIDFALPDNVSVITCNYFFAGA